MIKDIPKIMPTLIKLSPNDTEKKLGLKPTIIMNEKYNINTNNEKIKPI